MPLKLFCIASVQIIHLPEAQDPQGQPIGVPSQIKMEHCYAKDMLHPVTQSVNRYVVGDRFHDGPKSASHKRDTCNEMIQFQSVTSEVINSKIKTVRLQSSSQQICITTSSITGLWIIGTIFESSKQSAPNSMLS